MTTRIWIDRKAILFNKVNAPKSWKPPFRVKNDAVHLEPWAPWHVHITGPCTLKYDEEQRTIDGVSAWIETESEVVMSDDRLCGPLPNRLAQDAPGERIDVV